MPLFQPDPDRHFIAEKIEAQMAARDRANDRDRRRIADLQRTIAKREKANTKDRRLLDQFHERGELRRSLFPTGEEEREAALKESLDRLRREGDLAEKEAQESADIRALSAKAEELGFRLADVQRVRTDVKVTFSRASEPVRVVDDEKSRIWRQWIDEQAQWVDEFFSPDPPEHISLRQFDRLRGVDRDELPKPKWFGGWFHTQSRPKHITIKPGPFERAMAERRAMPNGP